MIVISQGSDCACSCHWWCQIWDRGMRKPITPFKPRHPWQPDANTDILKTIVNLRWKNWVKLVSSPGKQFPFKYFWKIAFIFKVFPKLRLCRCSELSKRAWHRCRYLENYIVNLKKIEKKTWFNHRHVYLLSILPDLTHGKQFFFKTYLPCCFYLCGILPLPDSDCDCDCSWQWERSCWLAGQSRMASSITVS